MEKQQIPHGLNSTPTSAKMALVGDPGSAVRDDNLESLSLTARLAAPRYKPIFGGRLRIGFATEIPRHEERILS